MVARVKSLLDREAVVRPTRALLLVFLNLCVPVRVGDIVLLDVVVEHLVRHHVTLGVELNVVVLEIV